MPSPSSLRKSQRSAKSSKKPNVTGHESEVIFSCPIPLTSAREMIDSAKGKIVEVLGRDELSARPVDDHLVGNPRGFDHTCSFSRLEKLENGTQDLRTDVDYLKGELKEQIRELKGELDDLHARISGLEYSFGDLHNTRSRFISFAKRDKLKSATHHDIQIIAAGNHDFHGGNVIADARLYTHGKRTDIVMYEFLYGIHPSVALMLDYEPTITLLSMRATYVASPGHAITKQFNDLSSKFLNALEETKYAAGYLEQGKKTPATEAHWDLLTFLNHEGPQ